MFVPQPQSRPKFSPYPSSPHFKIPLGERLSRGDFATYGRSPKKPTVGRLDDLQWVASTTYRRFFSPPPLRGLESPLVAPFG